MLRQRLMADLTAIDEGRDPSGLLRDPERNQRIPLPAADREFLLHGLPREELLRHPVWRAHFEGFRFAYGQPTAVREQFRSACGL
jgi:5,5'-dehydrodivanillate O-demethylase